MSEKSNWKKIQQFACHLHKKYVPVIFNKINWSVCLKLLPTGREFIVHLITEYFKVSMLEIKILKLKGYFFAVYNSCMI